MDYSKFRSSSKSTKTSINRSYNQAASIATKNQPKKMKELKNSASSKKIKGIKATATESAARKGEIKEEAPK